MNPTERKLQEFESAFSELCIVYQVPFHNPESTTPGSGLTFQEAVRQTVMSIFMGA